MGRAEEVKQERRRRNSDGLAGRRMRLATDESKLDREKWSYRWANDDANRLHDLTTHDDYEIAPEGARSDSIGMGSETAVAAGTTREGHPMRAVLLRKPREYYQEDERSKMRAIDETEAALRGGNVPGANTSELTRSDLKISRG